MTANPTPGFPALTRLSRGCATFGREFGGHGVQHIDQAFAVLAGNNPALIAALEAC